ncbi:MAG: sigma-70 family RNA polymerase sigma factor [Mediterranea massiliensis]|nr:sigma-70 family RNA polymerase sigma factor [Mediterranea massiliensis]
MSEETLISTFTELRGRFVRMVMRFLPSEEDADDVLQEAFCRLWPRADCLQGRQMTEAMAVTTLKNLCIDEVRRRGRVEQVTLDAERDGGITDSPLEEMEQRERFELLQQLIEQELSPVQRQILKMRDYEGMEMGEIAQEVGMTEANVRMNLSRARKRIREVYRERRIDNEG